MESATTPPWVRTKLAASNLIQAAPVEMKKNPDEDSPAERGTLALDGDEVSSEDDDFQESETIESMYVLRQTQP